MQKEYKKIDQLKKCSITGLKTLFLGVIFLQTACKKLVEIDAPTNSITTSEVFSDSLNAVSAIAGIYSGLINTGGSMFFGNGAITAYAGLSSDELVNFSTYSDITQFYTNSLNDNNTIIASSFWSKPYGYIYQANASIEALQASTGIPQTAKNRLLGEVKFLRAFFYFYLVNLFGDVPYVTSTTWKQTAVTARTEKNQVYQSIVSDLKEAQEFLPSDYASAANERVRATKWSATALLARIYLYTGDWTNAVSQASAIISNTNFFNLVPDLDGIFLANSSEAILQWQINSSFDPYNATTEGYNLIPFDATSNPSFYLSDQLLNGFENGDQRKIAWVDSTSFDGVVYYYPHKYKIGPAQQMPNATPSEYYMVLRLTEQYLIHAEASAEQNKLADAIADINLIRRRAGLPDLPDSLDQAQTLSAIMQERRIELFAEWGHRWLDLKRTGQADAVLGPIKTTWQTNAQLYPIPLSELQSDSKLTQNAGY